MNQVKVLHLFQIVLPACLAISVCTNDARAELIAQHQDGVYIVRNFSAPDAERIADIVAKYVSENKVDLIFLGEAHHHPAIMQSEIGIVKKTLKNQNDCVSVELANVDTGRPLFSALNRRQLSRDQWLEVYRSYWKYVCQLLDVRFEYNGQCYSQEAFDNQGNFFWNLAKESPSKVFGHEVEMVDFHDALFDLHFNDADRSSENTFYTKKKWYTHLILRNQKHAENIAKNYLAGRCKKMVVIEGSAHLEHDDALRNNLIRSENRKNLTQWPLVTPVQDVVSRELGLKKALIRLNKAENFSKVENKADLTFIFE